MSVDFWCMIGSMLVVFVQAYVHGGTVKKIVRQKAGNIGYPHEMPPSLILVFE